MTFPSRYSFITLIILFASNACTDTRVIDEEAKSRLDSELKAFVDEGRVAGTSALIYEDGKEVYFNAFGYEDQENGLEMDRKTIALIYSMTKPITGTALMQQYEQGKFSLDDPLEDYLPEYQNIQVFEGFDEHGDPMLTHPKRTLTIRDITRHTSGFANDTNTPYVGEILAETAPMNPDHSLAEFSEKLATIPLVFHPGEQWYYGMSVDVQARLVEVLSGQPFDEYLRQHILDPLGMEETRFVVPESEWERISSLYQKGEDGALKQLPDESAHSFNRTEHALTPGGWGLTSTLDDHMKFAQMLVHLGTRNGVQILKPETVQLMATNQLSDEVTERLWLPSKGRVGFGIDFAVRTKPAQGPDENVGMVGEFFWDGAASPCSG